MNRSRIVRSARAPRLLLHWLVITLGTLVLTQATFSAEPADNAEASDSSPTIVCLHTEYYPLPPEGEKKRSGLRIVRELGRQAVLIAARDELGLPTRDETLGEPFPEDITAAGKNVHVKVRSYLDGDLFIDFSLSSAPPEGEAGEQEDRTPLTTIKRYAAYSALLNLTEALEKLSRNELAARLRELGFESAAPAANEENVPPDAVEDLLLEMNFVSQYAAVRAAHAAIAEKGQSSAWLGILARGYANLALMTQHHWKSNNEVCAARALLYAERLLNTAPEKVAAHAVRAYVRAIVGLHAAALHELEAIESLQEASGDGQPLPSWLDLIGPYCSFERQPLLDISARRASLRQLAELLSFEQHRAFGDDRWMMESARRTMEVCPEEYGTYAALAVPGASLGVGRMGAYYAPAALSHFLPQRIARLDDLPEAVAKDIQAGDGNDKNAGDRPADANPQDVFSIVPSYIAQDLRAATQSGVDTGEPSWSVLGDLIAEEQFAQAANYLEIATNATETSLADDVEGVLPLVKDHRFARHIESYGVNMRRDPARFYQVIGDMRLDDPRGNMQPMFWRTWRATNDKGQNRRGYDAAWYAFFGRNLTFPGMLESYQRLASALWQQIKPADREMFARDFRRISPHSPHTLRLQIMLAAEPAYEQAMEWEAEAGEDPQVFVTLGWIYHRLQQFEDSIRCYERSIELSPTKDAYVGLANAHRAAGQEELWQPTLERFFEVDSLGLEHAQVHSLIANDLIAKGRWKDAEPHALQAAETWSAWGLQLAADVYEALDQKDESEKWIREMSTNYPSSSGDEWYFWCRRNDHGDIEQALATAEMHFSADWMKTNDMARHKLFTFHMLKGDSAAALEDAKYLFDRYNLDGATPQNRVYHQLQLVFLARDTKEDDIESDAMAGVRRTLADLREKDPDLATVVEFVCRLLDGETVDEAMRADVDQHLAATAIPPTRRCNHEYFIARGFDLRGDKPLAEEYYTRAIRKFRDNRETSALAGMRLAELQKAQPASD